jgi:hypothetical protein
MGEWRYSSTILDLGNRWMRVVKFTPGPLNPGDRATGTQWIGGWVGHTAGLDLMEEREISFPCRKSKPGRPFRSLSLYRRSYPGSYYAYNRKL